MKKIVFSVVILCTSAVSAFAASGKIAYLDTQKVFDQTKLGKKYQGILKEYYESRKKILDLDADEIKKQRDEYEKQSASGVLKPEVKKEKEEAIARKINEFEKKRNEFNNELGKKNEELSEEFNQEMFTLLKDMAKKEKISIILNKSINITQKGEVPAVLYGDEDLDLTERIIAEMDKKFESKK